MWEKLGQTKSWGDLSGKHKAMALLLGAAQSVLLLAALKDISGRSDEQINGSRLKWQAITFINIAGPLYYFRYGRRKPS